MLLMVNGQFPTFDRDTVAGGLVVPTCWLPNVMDGLARLTTGAAPVPTKPTVWVLPGWALLLSVNVSKAFRVPTADGLKVTATVQLALTARVPGGMQVLPTIANSPESLLTMLVMVSGAVPLFDRDTVADALVVFSSWLLNVRGVGAKLTTGAAPVPTRPTVC
jgi:hypothetical protein